MFGPPYTCTVVPRKQGSTCNINKSMYCSVLKISYLICYLKRIPHYMKPSFLSTSKSSETLKQVNRDKLEYVPLASMQPRCFRHQNGSSIASNSIGLD